MKMEMKVAVRSRELPRSGRGAGVRQRDSAPTALTLALSRRETGRLSLSKPGTISMASRTVRQHRIKLDPEQIKPGSTVFLRAAAWDERFARRLGRIARSRKRRPRLGMAIKIIGAEEKNSAAIGRLENLRAAIWKILEKQVHARTVAAGIAKTGQLAERTALAGDVRTQQIDVQKSSAELVKSLAPSENEERRTIKRVLGGLASDEMLAAVQQSDELVEAEAVRRIRQNRRRQLLAVQDRIIDTLRKLLDAARSAEAKLLAEMEKRPGGNLPDDVRAEARRSPRRSSNEFLKEQKKIIEASENLAKKPVEDFTEEQEQKL